MGLEVQASDAPREPDPIYYIWPENVPLWSLWFRLQTQWRIGAGGREGLDYAGVSAYMQNVARIKPRHFAQAFACIQAMECAALDEWAKQRDRQK